MNVRVQFFLFSLIALLVAPGPALCASENVPDTAAGMAAELDFQLAERLGAEPPVKGATLIVTTPTDLDDLERTIPIARLISEEMSGWFVAAGYRVTEMRKGKYVLFKPKGGELLLTRKPELLAEKFQESGLILTGTYTATAKYIRFNMRLIQAATGEVAAMSSRTLAISADTAELAGEERYKAFSRLRPSVSTRLPSRDAGPIEETAEAAGEMFSWITPGGREQHPVYAPEQH